MDIRAAGAMNYTAVSFVLSEIQISWVGQLTSAAGAMDCTHIYQIPFRLIPDEFFLWVIVVILKSCHKSYLSSGSIFLWWLFKCKSNCSTRVFIFCPDHPWLPSSDIPKRHSIFFLRAISNCEAVHHIKGVWSTKETKKNQVDIWDWLLSICDCIFGILGQGIWNLWLCICYLGFFSSQN